MTVSDAADCIFLNVRGPSNKWGPNWNTRAYNNTVYMTGEGSQGLVCGGDCSPDVLVYKNNIVWAEWKGAWVDGQPDFSNNIFWSNDGDPLIQNLQIDPTSDIIDPGFRDPEAGDFSLLQDSPALNAGTDEVLQEGFDTDINGISIPQGGLVDIGAIEYTGETKVQSVKGLSLKPGRDSRIIYLNRNGLEVMESLKIDYTGIYDLQGRLVQSKDQPAPAKGLKPGFYVIKKIQ
jgi:hypothetical protein